MKKVTHFCDIENREHSGKILYKSIDVIFDHDQEDGKSKTNPYLDRVDIDICESCWNYMMKNRIYIYAYGAMGFNKYYLKEDL
ncbi:MAG: hypothetical protein BWY19_00942 [bacterium ADurb.Bin212]|nr:MAG: hypothetical protein BWY19_00942 [bacterium ADurb.Bin212]